MRSALLVVDSPQVLPVARRFLGRHPEASLAQSALGSIPDVPVIDLDTPLPPERSPDLVVLWHCQQIVPASVLRTHRFINVHPGLNPHNRGWYPHVFAIANGTPAGVTIHEVDERIDHGPIITQKQILIAPSDTSAIVYRRLLEAEEELLEESFPALLSGDYRTYEPVGDGSFHTRADFEALCELKADARMSISEVLSLLRALSHPPFWNAFFIQEGIKVGVRVETRIDPSHEHRDA